MNGISTYAATDVVLSFGGYSVIGWDEIKVHRDTAQANFIRGIRGKNTRILNFNSSAVISLTCPQTSPAHAILNQIVAADKTTGGNARMEVSLKDTNGGLIFLSNQAYVTGYPDVTYKNSIENYTWLIQCYASVTTGLESTPPTSSLITNVLKRL